ncbi:hypothetical protein ACFL1F_00100 [Chlamydiota bacterium]
MRLLTTDLFEGAYLLSQGMELNDIWTDTNGKRSVIFEFSGSNIEVLKNKYCQGEAQANVLTFKRSLNELKDRMFCLLREHRINRGDRDPLRAEELRPRLDRASEKGDRDEIYRDRIAGVKR